MGLNWSDSLKVYLRTAGSVEFASRLKMEDPWGFPGGSEVKTLLLVQEVPVLPLLGELSSLGSFFSPGSSLRCWGKVLPMCMWKCPQSFPFWALGDPFPFYSL